MKLLSWNVNGLRSVLGKGFLDFLRESRPEVLCLQEIKAQEDQLDHSLWPRGYQCHWNSAEKKGYAGTAVFTRVEPLNVTRGLGVGEPDIEGRVLNLEFEDFFLVNVYTPNSQRGLTRLEFRTREWDPAFHRHLKKLERRKPVIFCGDLNVSHQAIDLANPKSNERNAGFTPEERGTFDRLLKSGFLDTFREFEPGGGHYTWWSYRSQARQKNIGWRLDYFGISRILRDRLKMAFILKDVLGSDHCPVGISLD